MAVCGSVSFAAPVMGFLGVVGVACVGVWVFASSVCFFRGAARLAAFAKAEQQHCMFPHSLLRTQHQHTPRPLPPPHLLHRGRAATLHVSTQPSPHTAPAHLTPTPPSPPAALMWISSGGNRLVCVTRTVTMGQIAPQTLQAAQEQCSDSRRSQNLQPARSLPQSHVNPSLSLLQGHRIYYSEARMDAGVCSTACTAIIRETSVHQLKMPHTDHITPSLLDIH